MNNKRTWIGSALTVLMVFSFMAVASAFEFISTNDVNREVDLPHVNEMNVGKDWVELDFVNPTSWLFAFEYRVDGEDTPYPGYEHSITEGDYFNIVNVNGSEGTHSVNMTINANEKVEVRLALGAESDYYFDWVTFYTEPEIEYKAAPAVATQLLKDANVDNRYGKGRDGGNHIADVAQMMGNSEEDLSGTDFIGVTKNQQFEYMYTIAEFLQGNGADVDLPQNALQSAVYQGEGDLYGSHVGDKMTFTFDYDISKDATMQIRFDTAQELWEGWGDPPMNWEIDGNQLIVTASSTFGNPRDLVGDMVTIITGLVDANGNPVVVPDGGIAITN